MAEPPGLEPSRSLAGFEAVSCRPRVQISQAPVLNFETPQDWASAIWALCPKQLNDGRPPSAQVRAGAVVKVERYIGRCQVYLRELFSR
jgi:hypothetical protein